MNFGASTAFQNSTNGLSADGAPMVYIVLLMALILFERVVPTGNGRRKARHP